MSNKDGQTARDVAMISGFDHAVQYLSQFQSNASHSVQGNLKRSLDNEDELNKEVKRVCNGFTWPLVANGISQENTSHDQSQLGNAHTDHAMEVQCNNKEVLAVNCKEEQFNSTNKLYRLPTQLSLPYRCLGSHYI